MQPKSELRPHDVYTPAGIPLQGENVYASRKEPEGHSRGVTNATDTVVFGEFVSGRPHLSAGSSGKKITPSATEQEMVPHDEALSLLNDVLKVLLVESHSKGGEIVRCFHLTDALRLGNNGDLDTVIVPGQRAFTVEANPPSAAPTRWIQAKEARPHAPGTRRNVHHPAGHSVLLVFVAIVTDPEETVEVAEESEQPEEVNRGRKRNPSQKNRTMGRAISKSPGGATATVSAL